MIGTPPEISADLVLASLSTTFTEGIESLRPEELQQLCDEIRNGKRLRFVVDVAPGLAIHILTHDGQGLTTRHVITIADGRDRSHWVSDLLRPAS